MGMSGSSSVGTICYFNSNDIWNSIGSFPVHWDGVEWTLFHLQNMGLDVSIINSTWGTSSDNIYFAGNGGSLVHYNGTDFTTIESGIDEDFRGISGNDTIVLAYSRTKLIQLEGLSTYELTEVQDFIIANEGDRYSIMSVEMDPTGVLLTTTRGFYKYKHDNADIYKISSIEHEYFYHTGSNGLEDVWWNGYGVFVHYNGKECTLYEDYSDTNSSLGFRVFNNIEVNNNLVVAGGICSSGAMIVIGHRN
jgi:hypothetical protein